MSRRVLDPAAPVYDRNPAKLVIPGHDLAAEIRRGLSAGRPGVVVGLIPGADPSSRRTLGVPNAGSSLLGRRFQPLRELIPSEAALALETGHEVAVARLGPHARAALRRLYAAALKDVAGLTGSEVVDECGYSSEPSAFRAVADGRRAWQAAGGWPWVGFDSKGRPPSSWRSQGAEDELADLFAWWRTGRISVAEFGELYAGR